MQLTHTDLFSGIGGFSLAASWLGIQTIAQVEIDEYCQEKLTKNFPDVPKYGDIANYQPVACDVLTAGLPCQPFSVAGKRLGKDDPRYLWDEVERVIDKSQPKLFILENVQGLLTNDKGRTFDGILRDLSKAGYDAEWYTIPATAVGAIHRRDRLWVIAWKANTYTQSSQRQVSWCHDMQTRANTSPECKTTLAWLSRKLSERQRSRSNNGLSARLARIGQDVPVMPLNWNGLLYGRYEDALNGDRSLENRKAIQAYGNAIVPQIAYCVLDYGLSKIGAR